MDPMKDMERRIEKRAWHLWEAAGSPEGQLDEYRQEARLLIALEDDPEFATEPVSSATRDRDKAEPVEAIENQGEFPTLTDQGETSPLPKRPARDDGSRR
jgi:hypothetical protein